MWIKQILEGNLDTVSSLFCGVKESFAGSRSIRIEFTSFGTSLASITVILLLSWLNLDQYYQAFFWFQLDFTSKVASNLDKI